MTASSCEGSKDQAGIQTTGEELVIREKNKDYLTIVKSDRSLGRKVFYPA